MLHEYDPVNVSNPNKREFPSEDDTQSTTHDQRIADDAATLMRDKCVGVVRSLSIRSDKYPDRYISAAAFKTRVECALESLTLDQVVEKQKGIDD